MFVILIVWKIVKRSSYEKAPNSRFENELKVVLHSSMPLLFPHTCRPSESYREMLPLRFAVFAALVLIPCDASIIDLFKPLFRMYDRHNHCLQAEDLKCPNQNVTFWLYTRSTQQSPTQVTAASLSSAPFVNASLKIIVHGWSVDKDTAINEYLRPAYFAHGEYNIVSVDWSPLGRTGCYGQASRNVPTIGACVAQFVGVLLRARAWEDAHLLCHSMGAHICYWATQNIPDLPRLTIFDAAFPLFGDDSSLLQQPRASFTDVYHSNCNLKGRLSPDGDLDVYFNNGIFQPGCGCDTSCSHNRAVQYFAESIGSPQPLKAFLCPGWSAYKAGECPVPAEEALVTVGEHVNTSISGRYLTFTRSRAPYLLEAAVLSNASSLRLMRDMLDGDCQVYDAASLLKDWFTSLGDGTARSQ